MKKTLTLFLLFTLLSASMAHALSPLPHDQVDLGTFQPLQITQDPFTKNLQASIQANPFSSTATQANRLDMYLTFKQIYTPGSGTPSEFSISLMTRGKLSYQPRDLTLTLQEDAPIALRLSPREVIRSTRGDFLETQIVYSLSDYPEALRHIQNGNVTFITIACALEDGTIQTQFFKLSDHLREELKKITALDLSQEGTFQLTKPQ